MSILYGAHTVPYISVSKWKFFIKLIGQRAFDENVAAETRQQVFDDLRKALERDPHPHPSHSNSHERDKHDSADDSI